VAPSRRYRPDCTLAREIGQLLRQRWKHWRPADRGIQPARRREQRIADRLAVRSFAVLVAEPTVFWIAIPVPDRLRWLAIGRTGHDQSVQRLEAPSAVDQLRRQPVEEGRMTRLGAHPAEVAGRFDQSPPKMPLPHAVDNHPGSQWVIWPGQPLRERP